MTLYRNQPSMGHLIDFHSHNLLSTDAIVSVGPMMVDESIAVNREVTLSVGIHPWETDRADRSGLVESLYREARRPNVAAIGEAGLDKLRGGSMEKQLELFERHVELSERVGKPLIIHCVKAWEELLQAKRRAQPRQPWGIHGFRGGAELARQLVAHGFYISLGEHFNREAARAIPSDRLLVETDESRMSIADITKRIIEYRGDSGYAPGVTLAAFLKSIPG